MVNPQEVIYDNILIATFKTKECNDFIWYGNTLIVPVQGYDHESCKQSSLETGVPAVLYPRKTHFG